MTSTEFTVDTTIEPIKQLLIVQERLLLLRTWNF